MNDTNQVSDMNNEDEIYSEQLTEQFKNVLDTKKNYIDNLYKIYSALSYKRTLARGYSIIRDKKMNLVTSKTSAIKAHELSIEFSEDIIEVEVKNNK